MNAFSFVLYLNVLNVFAKAVKYFRTVSRRNTICTVAGMSLQQAWFVDISANGSYN